MENVCDTVPEREPPASIAARYALFLRVLLVFPIWNKRGNEPEVAVPVFDAVAESVAACPAIAVVGVTEEAVRSTTGSTAHDTAVPSVCALYPAPLAACTYQVYDEPGVVAYEKLVPVIELLGGTQVLEPALMGTQPPAQDWPAGMVTRG